MHLVARTSDVYERAILQRNDGNATNATHATYPIAHAATATATATATKTTTTATTTAAAAKTTTAPNPWPPNQLRHATSSELCSDWYTH
jgi:hypothetical protein